jgi:hypothetical protein
VQDPAVESRGVIPGQRTIVYVVAIVLVTMLLADLALIWAFDAVQVRPEQITSGWLLRRSMVQGVLMGTLGAQLLLAVAYSAFGDGASLKRIFWTTILLIVFTNLLILMSVVLNGSDWGQGVLMGFLFPMGVFFFLQIPVWGIRGWFRWTIKSPWSELRQTRYMRFSLAEMLLWSVFVAVPLGILQIGMALSDALKDLEFLLGIAVWTIVGCVYLLWFLNTSLAHPMSKWKVLAALGLPVLAATIIAISTDVARYGRVDWNLAVSVASAFSAVSVSMVLCLQLAHRCGFRFVRLAKT